MKDIKVPLYHLFRVKVTRKDGDSMTQDIAALSTTDALIEMQKKITAANFEEVAIVTTVEIDVIRFAGE